MKSDESDYFDLEEGYGNLLDWAEQFGKLISQSDSVSSYSVSTEDISFNEAELRVMNNSDYPVKVQKTLYSEEPDFVLVSDEGVGELLEES